MSAANAAAKKRRSVIPSSSSSEQPISGQPQQQQPSAGYSLPQVIAIIDNRLVNLEKGMVEIKQSTTNSIKSLETQINNVVQNETQTGEQITIDETELGKQLDLLTKEFVDLKSIVLKLQSYTLDVVATIANRQSSIEKDSIHQVLYTMDEKKDEECDETETTI